jgi:hypothetical protein
MSHWLIGVFFALAGESVLAMQVKPHGYSARTRDR